VPLEIVLVKKFQLRYHEDFGKNSLEINHY